MISKSMGDVLLSGYGRLASRLPGLLPPLGYFLYITGQCNLDCVYCWQREQDSAPADGFVNAARDPLPPEAWVRLVERLPRRCFIGLSGGEATLSPAFRPILAAAGRRPVTVNTNAVRLRDADVALLTAGGVRNVSVSLDGFAEVHDVSRNRPGLFERTVANLARLNQARRAAGRRAPRLTIKTVVTAAALPRLEAFHRFCAETLEADALNLSLEKTGGHAQFSLFHAADPDRVWRDGRAALAPYPDHAALGLALKRLLASPLARRCPVILYPRMTTPAQVDTVLAARGQGCYRPCGLPRAMVTVLPDGTVIPCQSQALGNVRDHDWRVGRVLRQPAYREACARVAGFGAALPPSCALCCFAEVAR